MTCTTPANDNARIVAPEERHLDGIIQLSRAFAQEHDWAGTIPIGQINSSAIARAKLFGPNVIAALVAETDSGDVVGYTGVYRNEEGIDISLSIAASHRRRGLASALVTEVFRRLPPGSRVEAWVGHFNEASLVVTPKLGFQLERIIEHDERKVYVFVRQA